MICRILSLISVADEVKGRLRLQYGFKAAMAFYTSSSKKKKQWEPNFHVLNNTRSGVHPTILRLKVILGLKLKQGNFWSILVSCWECAADA
ncbi:hypothetical protein QL285_082562 [Trifolium repens]|nr:hypothetical protein QL285_082562 [Trifolium repens]